MSHTFSALEITLISVQILIIPFARYLLKQYKKEILDTAISIINEHYTGLSDRIDHNKNLNSNIRQHLKHNEELAKLKSQVLISRIRDLEAYLEDPNRQGGFRPRQYSQISQDDSGLF